jgi:hypothetical protein
MHTLTVALAIGTAVVLAGCGTQDGGGRAQPTAPASAVQPSPAPTVVSPPPFEPPANPPVAAPVPPSSPSAQPAAQPGILPGASATTASSGPPAAGPALSATASPALPSSATQAPADSPAENDLRISREVRAGLTRDGHLARDSRNVQVSTSAGVVTLTGTVTGDADRRAIRSQAERVSGVVRVEDQLVVR